MRRLFVKIFAWFWLTTALVVGVIAAITFTFDPVPRPPRVFDEATAALAFSAIETVERDGAGALPAWEARAEATGHITVYVFDGDGRPIDGRDAPPFVRDRVARGGPDGTPPGEFDGSDLTIVSRQTSPSGRRYVLATVREGGPRADLMAHPGPFLVRLLAVALTAGLVCYWLARHIAAPVATLRAATARLAAGDLSARVVPALGRRRDELTSLGRDFDFMAERIESLVVAQQTLLRDISHELRSPLARLGVALELARQRSGPDAAAALDRIERESERLNEMIGRLLTLTRLETDAAGVAVESLDLADVVRAVVADADFEARASYREVRTGRLDACPVRGNEQLLRSAVENVVRNAVRYTPPGTAVEVDLDRGEAAAVVTVRDRGEGVPDAALADIFRAFYRVADARDRRTGGTGLGLAITERAARFHGGSVRAENAPGGGLSVEIRVPVSPA